MQLLNQQEKTDNTVKDVRRRKMYGSARLCVHATDASGKMQLQLLVLRPLPKVEREEASHASEFQVTTPKTSESRKILESIVSSKSQNFAAAPNELRRLREFLHCIISHPL